MRQILVRTVLGMLLVIPAVAAAQEPAVITGVVVRAADRTPLAGVAVRIERVSARAVTTADGRYQIVIPAARFTPGDSVTVTASRIGLSTSSRRVELRGGTSEVNFVLAEAALHLESVVVTGMGTPGAAVAGDGGSGAGRAGPDSEPGVLTASVLDDLSPRGWREYQRFLRRHPHGQEWGLEPREAVRIRFLGSGRPLRDHVVSVQQGERRYELRTRADGTIRIFPRLEHRLENGEFTVTPRGGVPQRLVLSPALVRRQVTVNQPIAPLQAPRPTLDILLLVDATGSMQDEMSYLQTELRDIVTRVQPRGSQLEVRISVVYYRDRGDEFVTRPHAFTTNVDSTADFLAATRADGGGDTPEEMNEALRVAMEQAWSDGPAARMLFVVADAPPHPYPDARYTYHDALVDATRRGISVFPVAASGVDRPTEYLMRAMAVMTGGKYLFLTDDSGVGNPHLTPDQDFDVHKLNDLMVREIRQFVAGYYPRLNGLAAR